MLCGSLFSSHSARSHSSRARSPGATMTLYLVTIPTPTHAAPRTCADALKHPGMRIAHDESEARGLARWGALSGLVVVVHRADPPARWEYAINPSTGTVRSRRVKPPRRA